MKKTIFTILLVSTCSLGFSQLREKGTIELAPQIGYATSQYTGDEVYTNTSSIGSVTFGVGADYFFNDRWSIRSGLFSQTMGTESGSFKEELNYLTIPINANWHFGSTRKWYLNFGPSVGFLLSAKSDGDDVKDLVNSTQIGLIVGIGYKIEVSEKFSILIDYQGNSGLTKVAKEGDINFKNSFGSFNVGGVFKL